MDRRNEPEFINKMYGLISRLSNSCKSCPRKMTSACMTCWANEAGILIDNMNAPTTLSKTTTNVDRTEETEQILQYINTSCGVTTKMIANTFPKMTNNTVRSALKLLINRKQIVTSVTGMRVYFPQGTPADAIDGITQSFQQNNRRKGKHGNSKV